MGIVKTVIGVGQTTKVLKFDNGNSYREFKAKETDNFLTFKDRGEINVLFKTIPAKINPKGVRLYTCMETDIHTYNINTGEVVSKEFESWFKGRLKKKAVEELEKTLSDTKTEMDKEHYKKAYQKLLNGEIGDIENLKIEIPEIQLGETTLKRIDDLTPHDTVNETINMVMGDKILKNLLDQLQMSKWMVAAILIVGMASLLLIEIFLIAAFPVQWGQLIGTVSVNPPPVPLPPPEEIIIPMMNRLAGLVR